MKVYEVKLKLFLLKDIPVEKAQSALGAFIDQALAKDENLLRFHKENSYKNYCFDSLYPIEKNKVYKEGRLYTLTLRTLERFLVDFTTDVLTNERDYNFKALTSEIRIIPKRHIEKLYTLTPAIMKSKEGYWRGTMTLENYERRLKENLIKKYKRFTGISIDEKFELYSCIEFLNKSPISVAYKDITLLGDKLTLNISENKLAQDLAYMSLGTGLMENNSRGCGFLNYRWL